MDTVVCCKQPWKAGQWADITGSYALRLRGSVALEGEMAPLDLSVVQWQTDEIFKCLFEDDEKAVGFRSFQCPSDVETDGPGDSGGKFCLHLQPQSFGWW